jgi:hypothetical protein
LAASSIPDNFASPKVSNPKSQLLAAAVLAEITALVRVANISVSCSNNSLTCCIFLSFRAYRWLPIVSQRGQQGTRSVLARLPADNLGLASDVLFALQVTILSEGLALFSTEAVFQRQRIDES